MQSDIIDDTLRILGKHDESRFMVEDIATGERVTLRCFLKRLWARWFLKEAAARDGESLAKELFGE